jgi:hypothetical protein
MLTSVGNHGLLCPLIFGPTWAWHSEHPHGAGLDAMSILSPAERRQLERDGIMPIEDGAFVVLRADVFERVRPLIVGEELTLEEQRRLLSELGKSVGWDDPAMDVYNDL